MKQIKVNPNNEQFYSKEFIRGFDLGAERQYEADIAGMPKWIPCSERLPELHRSKYVPHPYLEQSSLFEDYYMISEPVLVTRINPFIEPEERIVVAQYEDDLDGRVYWQTTDAEQLVDVVAWMPLPDPYNKGGNK